MVDTLKGNVADLVTDAAAKVPGRVALVVRSIRLAHRPIPRIFQKPA